MFTHVQEAKYIKDYKIWRSFNNGKHGEIDLEPELYGEIFEPLKDISLFKSFREFTRNNIPILHRIFVRIQGAIMEEY